MPKPAERPLVSSGVKQAKVAAAPRRVREIAWKAQMRLCGRFRSLVRKGKRPTIAATAIARELSAFIRAINREIMGKSAGTKVARDCGPVHSPLQYREGIVADINRAAVRAGPRQGNSRLDYVADL